MSFPCGAKAKVYLNFPGELEELSVLISSKLSLPEFRVGDSEYEPFELVASCEALGFEMWLKKHSNIEGYSYEFEMETEGLLESFSEKEMCDLSFWLAGYLESLLGIMVTARE